MMYYDVENITVRYVTVVCIITKNVLIYVVINNVLSESQCGFLAGRGTTDIIFEMRTIQQMYLEQNQDLYMVFIDLTKVLIQSTEQGSGNCLQTLVLRQQTTPCVHLGPTQKTTRIK